MSRVSTCLAVSVVLLIPLALACQMEQVHVRGVLSGITPHVLTVTSRDGATVSVRLIGRYQVVMAVHQAELAAVTPGTYIGTAALRQSDGTLEAVGVLVFPDSERGTGGGHFEWDQGHESSMTNAVVTDIVASAEGRQLTLTYKGGAVKVTVPSRVPIGTCQRVDKRLLQLGSPVFMRATQQPDGTLTTARVFIGNNGFVPPL